MPVLTITTNLPSNALPGNFLAETSTMLQELMQKPMQYIVVRVHPDTMMRFGGTNDPCAIVELASMLNMSPELNANYIKVITDFLCPKMAIDKQRLFINCTEPSPEDVGYAGVPMAQIYTSLGIPWKK